VALGQGNGQFNAPIPLPSSITGIVALAPGDFTGSGRIDLAVASDTINVPDSLSTPASVYVLTGDGTGHFQVATQQSTGVLYSLITADLNHDGLDDILYTSGTGQTGAYYINVGVDLSKGQGAFSSATYSFLSSFETHPTTDIVTGDFNRDGNTDVLILGQVDTSGDAFLLLGAGAGTLNKTPQFYQGSMGRAVVLDLNGDGAPDVAGTTTFGVARLLNTGKK
jgi:hypothetical protein